MSPKDEARIDALEKNYQDLRAPIRIRAAFATAIWFALPFTTLWSFGVPVKHAAQLAAGPAACMGSIVLALGAVGMVTGMFAIQAIREGNSA